MQTTPSPTHYPAQHSCLACARHPATHAPATPDSDDACPMCGLGDEREESPASDVLDAFSLLTAYRTDGNIAGMAILRARIATLCLSARREASQPHP